MTRRLALVGTLALAGCRTEHHTPAEPPPVPPCEGKQAAAQVDTSVLVVNGVRYLVLVPRCRIRTP